MQVFFQELYSHIDKSSGEKFEDMFLVKITSKGTSLNLLQIDKINVKVTDTLFAVTLSKAENFLVTKCS